ncbi:MAG: hypothetical protein LUE91_01720 [Oscillospiraceae bacterium]|nr:hypothetical protein [Oscillospiraceae bacterium]
MSLLVTEKDPAALKRRQLAYLLVSLFCVLFGAVYEHYSHEVYSNCMLYAFVIPLAGGCLLSHLLDLLCRRRMPGRLAWLLYNFGIATLTVGCIFQGVLEIYGTTNRLMAAYWIAGAALLLSGAAGYAAALLPGGGKTG